MLIYSVCECTVLDLCESRGVTEQVGWQAKQPSSGFGLRWSEVLSWRRYLLEQSKGHLTSVTWRGEAQKEEILYNLPQKSSISQTSIWTVWQAAVGKHLREGWSTYGLSWVRIYHRELNRVLRLVVNMFISLYTASFLPWLSLYIGHL